MVSSNMIMDNLQTVILWGSSAVFLGLAALYTFQTRLIYMPQFPPGARSVIWRPSECGFHPKDDEEIYLTATDGTSVHGYWLSSENVGKGSPTFIYFQGNAGNIGHRLPLLRRLHELVPCNTFILSYRGFGKSQGCPNEAGIKMDAQAALDYVLSRADVDPNRVILYGQSIGGAVAFDLAARNQSKIHAVILENTFRSLRKLIPHVMPLIGWAARLCHQKWDSETRLQEMIETARSDGSTVALPHMLFLSGAKDTLVPPHHMRALYDAATGAASESNAKVVLEIIPNGDHVDTCIQPEYFPAIQRFISSLQ